MLVCVCALCCAPALTVQCSCVVALRQQSRCSPRRVRSTRAALTISAHLRAECARECSRNAINSLLKCSDARENARSPAAGERRASVVRVRVPMRVRAEGSSSQRADQLECSRNCLRSVSVGAHKSPVSCLVFSSLLFSRTLLGHLVEKRARVSGSASMSESWRSGTARRRFLESLAAEAEAAR